MYVVTVDVFLSDSEVEEYTRLNGLDISDSEHLNLIATHRVSKVLYEAGLEDHVNVATDHMTTPPDVAP